MTANSVFIDVVTLPPRGDEGKESFFLNESCDLLSIGKDKIFVVVRKAFIYENVDC